MSEKLQKLGSHHYVVDLLLYELFRFFFFLHDGRGNSDLIPIIITLVKYSAMIPETGNASEVNY